jgi:hypothetical protein
MWFLLSKLMFQIIARRRGTRFYFVRTFDVRAGYRVDARACVFASS